MGIRMNPLINIFLRWLAILIIYLALVSFFKQNLVVSAQTQNNDIKLLPGFTFDIVTKGLDGPTAFAFAPSGRIYITQKSGIVRVFVDNKLLQDNFIDISQEVNHAYNRGLAGIAIHPNFPQTPYVYLSYVYQPMEAYNHKEIGARLSKIIRLAANPANLNRAQSDTKVTLLGANSTFENIGNPDAPDAQPFTCEDGNKPIRDCIPVEGTAHQANMLRFGPDGALYVSVGDGSEHPAAGLRAQNLESLSGKILRINPLTGNGYTNNPYYNGVIQSNQSKIYMLGLRNPFRFAFYPSTSDLIIGDVGASLWEEVNQGRSGANFGWPCYENTIENVTSSPCDKIQIVSKQLVFPIHAFPHTEGRVAVIGGEFYTGSLFPTKYQGAYFFGDYNTGKIWTMTFTREDIQVQEFASKFSGVVQISIGPDEHLYVLTIRGGTLYRIRWTG